MSTGTKRTLSEGIAAAQAFRDLFPPIYFEAWEVAGSVRRRKPEVGDVEHVVRPYFAKVMSGGLFPEEVSVNMLWQQMDDLVAAGTLTKHLYGDSGFRYGPKHRGVEYQGVLHEVFLADEMNWGAQLLIRTGSAEFNQRIQTAFNRGGMYRQAEGYLRCIGRNGTGDTAGEIVPVPDEQTYLKLAGMAWIEPEARS